MRADDLALDVGLKSIHDRESGDEGRDADRDARAAFVHARLDLDAHGTGCTLAAAIAAHLCRGRTLLNDCEAAPDYVHGALLHSYRPGRTNVPVLSHFCSSK